MSGKDVRDTVGLLAVVAGLFFVGWEIRQNTDAARAAAAQAWSDSWLQWNLTMVQPEVQEALARSNVGENWEADGYGAELAVELHWFLASFQIWANMHFQYAEGHLDQSVWDAQVRAMETWARGQAVPVDVLSDHWARWSHVYHDGFRQFFDSLQAANAAP